MLTLLWLGWLFSATSFNVEFRQLRLQSTILSMKKQSASNLPNLQQVAFPEPADLYDLIVIGAGSGGESAAIHAAQLGARVAIIERKAAFGGPSGLTSKAVREAAKRIVKAVEQIGGSKKQQIKKLWQRKFPTLRTEAEVMQAKETRDRLKRNGVDLFIGTSTFVDYKGTTGLDIYDDDGQTILDDIDRDNTDVTVRVCRPGLCVDLHAKHAIVATGSRPHRPQKMAQRFAEQEKHREVIIPFRKGVVVDATEMGALNELPQQAAAVIGGGVIAIEYATILAGLGVGVSVVCPEEAFMPFLDEELRYRLKRQMKKNHVLFVTEAIKEITLEQKEGKEGMNSTVARISLEPRILPSRQIIDSDGAVKPPRKLPERKLTVDLILYSGGRDANSAGLGLDGVGVDTGRYGRILIDEKTFHTTAKKNSGYSIFAIGDVAGGGLASTAMQQARSLTEQLFSFEEEKSESVDELRAGPLSTSSFISDGMATDEPLQSFEEAGDDDLDVAIDDFFLEPVILPSPSLQIGGTLFGDSRGGSSLDAPLTLWTVPEIASVGYTVEQAQENAPTACCRDSIVTGYAYFRETARGRLTGGDESFLKIVAWKKKDSACHSLVGVHIMGEGANELIQLGSILLHAQVALQQVSKTPFAAVTLSALYQVACDDALMKLRKIRERRGQLAAAALVNSESNIK